MVKITENLSYNTNYYPERNSKQYITIHETANTGVGANANAHANFINNGSQETWHYTVDDTHAVKHFLHTTSCWAAGTYEGNTQSINIEMCINSDGNYKKTLQNTIELVKKIMKEEGISASHVVQHHYWSGKNCPTLLREGTHGMTWNQFVESVKGKSTTKTEVPKGWDGVNEYGTIYKAEKGKFTCGKTEIFAHLNSPKLSQKAGYWFQPKGYTNYDEVALSDGYVWIGYDWKGKRYYLPIREWNGKTGSSYKVGDLWGVIS